MSQYIHDKPSRLGYFQTKKLTIRHTAILHTVHEAACQQAGETSWFGSLHHASAAAKKWLSPSQPHTHGLQNCRWSRLSLESHRWISTGGFAGLNSEWQLLMARTSLFVQMQRFSSACVLVCSNRSTTVVTLTKNTINIQCTYSRRSPILSCSQYHRSSLSQVPLS